RPDLRPLDAHVEAKGTAVDLRGADVGEAGAFRIGGDFSAMPRSSAFLKRAGDYFVQPMRKVMTDSCFLRDNF
ncbi:MAG: hypothetical protein KGQ70_09415, partial [Alphaproteobacteria bacterium]|nr:hypothetical protein [Alphaproteobacteria bacterium]